MRIETDRPILAGIVIGVIGLVIAFILLMAPAQSPTAPSPPVSPNKEGLIPAPEWQGIAGYLNASPDFTLASQKGKVVLVDFWTFSCINCIRTQPYLNAWHEKYADQGLVIVGVHSPEFDFEKKYENVKSAVEKAGIQYPVVLDNDFATWKAYGNRYWPRKYLIDAEGFIRYDHIGEGSYAETEEVIQELLKERDAKIGLSETVSGAVSKDIESTDFSQIKTPEIYLGYAFARAPLANSEGFHPEEGVSYTLPSTMEPNLVALEGNWLNKSDYMELVSDTGKVELVYSAKNVNIVAANPSLISVSLDGATHTSFETGEEQLYPVVEGESYGTHHLEMSISGKGFRLYTFTFG